MRVWSHYWRPAGGLSDERLNFAAERLGRVDAGFTMPQRTTMNTKRMLQQEQFVTIVDHRAFVMTL
jgi:hypothetical protein